MGEFRVVSRLAVSNSAPLRLFAQVSLREFLIDVCQVEIDSLVVADLKNPNLDASHFLRQSGKVI